jgi:hypothetical protein
VIVGGVVQHRVMTAGVALLVPAETAVGLLDLALRLGVLG